MSSALLPRSCRTARLVLLSTASMASIAAGSCSASAPPPATTPAGSDAGTTTGSASDLVAQGGLQFTYAGSPIAVDFAGQVAGHTVTHKLNPGGQGPACITQFDLTVARPDGSCRLDLQWMRKADGLALAKARFFAVTTSDKSGSLVNCAGWPKEAGAGEIVFEGTSDTATISQNAVPKPHSGDKDAKVAGVTVSMSGTLDLKKAGKKFALDLGKLSFKGTLLSKGRTDVSCGSAQAVGTEFCAKTAEGVDPGSLLRRSVKLHRCDDDEPFDFGALCGNDAIWLVSHHMWLATAATNTTEGFGPELASAYAKWKDKRVGTAFILAEGAKKIAVPDPANPGKFKADGPAPTAQECNDLKAKYKIPDDVVMLYDKGKKLVFADSSLQSVNYIPWHVFARGDGVISSLLPKPDGKAPTGADVDAGIQKAIDGN